jgi:L-alanine-DL-glutamate epimerase-like enolase superfamily enzyme
MRSRYHDGNVLGAGRLEAGRCPVGPGTHPQSYDQRLQTADDGSIHVWGPLIMRVGTLTGAADC